MLTKVTKNLKSYLLVGVLLCATLLLAQPNQTARAKESGKLLEFDTMIGVPKPYTGSANPIRGINGGGLPWVVRDAKGILKSNGELEIKVKGLVFDPNDPDVISRSLAGQNTVPTFRAIVSCLSKDANNNPITVNLTTAEFPATIGVGAGDAKIEAQLALPTPCIAPIIFVTNPGGAWFASTGG